MTHRTKQVLQLLSSRVKALRSYCKPLWNILSSEQVVPLMYTVECLYNAVQFTTILFMALRWQEQNLNHTLTSQHTPHSSPVRAMYGVSIVRILKKIDRVITAPLCIQPIREAYKALPLNVRSIFSGMSYIHIILYVGRLHLKRDVFFYDVHITLLNNVWVTSLSAISANSPKMWSS